MVAFFLTFEMSYFFLPEFQISDMLEGSNYLLEFLQFHSLYYFCLNFKCTPKRRVLKFHLWRLLLENSDILSINEFLDSSKEKGLKALAILFVKTETRDKGFPNIQNLLDALKVLRMVKIDEDWPLWYVLLYIKK